MSPTPKNDNPSEAPKELTNNDLMIMRLHRFFQGEMAISNIDLLASTGASYSDIVDLILDQLNPRSDLPFAETIEKVKELLLQYKQHKNSPQGQEPFPETIALKKAAMELNLSDRFKPLVRMIQWRLDIRPTNNDSCLKALQRLGDGLDKDNENYSQMMRTITVLEKYLKSPVGTTINDDDRIIFWKLSQTFDESCQYLAGEIDDFIEATLRPEEDDDQFIMSGATYDDIEDEQMRKSIIQLTNIMNLFVTDGGDENDENEENDEAEQITLPSGLEQYLAKAGIL